MNKNLKSEMEEIMCEPSSNHAKVQKQMDRNWFYIWALIAIVGCLAVLIYGL